MAEQTPVPKEWFTMKEAAIYMGVSLATVRRWLRLGHINRYLPPGGAGNFVRVKKSELDQFMHVEPYKRWKPHRIADRLKSVESPSPEDICGVCGAQYRGHDAVTLGHAFEWQVKESSL